MSEAREWWFIAAKGEKGNAGSRRRWGRSGGKDRERLATSPKLFEAGAGAHDRYRMVRGRGSGARGDEDPPFLA